VKFVVGVRNHGNKLYVMTAMVKLFARTDIRSVGMLTITTVFLPSFLSF